MTSILFCRTCDAYFICDGRFDCPWLSPHDEANCSQQCLSPGSGPIPCDCNKPGNMTCGGRNEHENYVCYGKSSKFLALCFFVNVTMSNFGNVTIVVKLNKVSFISKDWLLVT